MAAILSALAFARRHWKWALIAALVAAIGGLVFLDSVHLRERDNARADTAAERAAHRQTAANFRLATAEANRRAAENVVRVKDEQRRIDERKINELQDRLADSDAGYQRLRAQAAAYSRSPVAADVSAAREATCRAYANAACDEIPPLLKAAQDNTAQLLSLIGWANDQAAVSVHAPEGD